MTENPSILPEHKVYMVRVCYEMLADDRRKDNDGDHHATIDRIRRIIRVVIT